MKSPEELAAERTAQFEREREAEVLDRQYLAAAVTYREEFEVARDTWLALAPGFAAASEEMRRTYGMSKKADTEAYVRGIELDAPPETVAMLAQKDFDIRQMLNSLRDRTLP